MTRQLTKKGHNYDGTSYVVKIIPERVFAWLTKDDAAGGFLESFLEGVTRRQVVKPLGSLLWGGLVAEVAAKFLSSLPST